MSRLVVWLMFVSAMAAGLLGQAKSKDKLVARELHQPGLCGKEDRFVIRNSTPTLLMVSYRGTKDEFIQDLVLPKGDIKGYGPQRSRPFKAKARNYLAKHELSVEFTINPLGCRVYEVSQPGG